ncbi:MAG: NTP transferase domain-containing protein [Tetrasphaera sp.]
MTEPRPAAVVILAAGEGTRMKSATPKVLHRIGGRSLLGHAIATARAVQPNYLAVVVRHRREAVAAHIAEVDPGAIVADQDEVKGTGRATECGLAQLPADLAGTVLVTYGDVPLLTGETLRDLFAQHLQTNSAVTVMTARRADAGAYGRIVRDRDGSVAAIVEFKDATPDQRAIQEYNSGIYAFDAATLRQALTEVGTDNAQQEKYLTDVVGLARAAGKRVSAYEVGDGWQTEGVNDRVELARLGAVLRQRENEKRMRGGVTIVDPDSTWIDVDVSIGQDTTILPGTALLGASTIGAGATIGPDVTVSDSRIGAGATVRRSEVHLAEVGADATVGPYTHLRPGATLGPGGQAGSFVEIGPSEGEHPA